MDRARGEKKRRKAIKTKQKYRESEEEEQEEPNEFDLPGINRVTLSPLTQKAIGCVIGEDITSENPWIYIPKEKVEDNMELHDESSEFLPLKQDIINYPEEDLLLGYNISQADVREQFFVCLTTDAKNVVLNILEKQEEELQEKLRSSLVKTPGDWKSLGSEIEIEESMIRNFRPLIEVELQTKYPIYDTKTKFAMRWAEDARDGYIETLSHRQEFNNVTRKRIDAAIQASPDTAATEAQTNPTYPKNVWTQYCFEYEEADLNKPIPKEAVNFLNAQIDQLCDEIRVNESINFHIDDYMLLSRDIPKPMSLEIKQEIIFQDVISCQSKKVSCMVWHPTISGLILVAYSNWPMNHFVHEENTADVVNETVHEKKVALLWCYTDHLQPKLYLECHREVTCIIFCEHNPNIIVGGCANGQVILWDITGRLEKVESREVLTTSEQKHRQIMNSMVSWMKNSGDAAYVQPTAISASNHSHKQAITSIMWLPPRWSINRNGKVEHDPDGASLQFLTCGLDGVINVWDLNSPPPSSAAQHTRRAGRLKTRPSALTLDISWLKALDKVFLPKFKLIVEDTYPVPISCAYMQKTLYEYVAQNPETENDMFKRTYFTQTNLDEKNFFEPSLYLGTSTGQFINVTWEGNEFDQGQAVNSEVCKINPYQSFHDGPIRCCTRNPKLVQRYMLTVGGTIFVIWDETHNKAIAWRKAEVEYVSGVWSSTMLNIFLLSRVDGHLEIWNLHTNVKFPTNTIHVTSKLILDLVTDNHKLHIRKNSVAMTDNTGAVHILRAPDLFSFYDMAEVQQALTMLLEKSRRKIELHNWIKRWQESRSQAEVVTEEDPDKEPAKTEEEEKENEEIDDEELDTFDKILTQKWKSKQEQDMYEILLKKKKLNLKEINRLSEPLRQDKEKKRAYKKKQAQRLAEKEKIFEKAKTLLFKETIIRERPQIKADYTEGKDIAELKKSYISDYASTAAFALDKIKQKPFRYTYDWNQLIIEGTERRNLLELSNCKVNLHRHRYEQQCRMEEEALRKTIIMDTVSRISGLSEESIPTSENIE